MMAENSTIERTDNTAEKYYEKELRHFSNEYYASEFVPFPTVGDAIDALTETAGSTLDGDMFLADVHEALGKLVQERMAWFTDTNA
jgi:hypothetical protein